MIAKKIVLHFPKRLVNQPIISRLVKEYDLQFNILKASVNPRQEGLLVIELSGEKRDYEKGLKYLQEAGVTVQRLSQDVRRNENKCTHCGACVPHCPTSALKVDPQNQLVLFDDAECIACELCVSVCPVQAMELLF
jgi:ferredoxin